MLLYTQVAASAITSQIGHIQICNYLLAPAVNLASSDTIFCDKNSVNFFLSANNPTSWLWFFQGGRPSVSTAQNPTNIYFPNAGAFDVLLIACNSAGCDTLFIPGFIIEYPLPVPPIVTLQGDTLYCSLANQYQ
ncbi:MAG: hypothetical protein IPO27_14695 [Bacteroidetes bacterium]|nr:hypothetical protein [Bacteroidota bacterium]